MVGGASRENSSKRLESHWGDSAQLERIVGHLVEIKRKTGLDRTLAIGELVLTEFFDGNVEAWRDRRRNKNNSIRRLANHDSCPFSKSALNDAVAIYVALHELPCVHALGHITAGHVLAVLSLQPGERREMLERAAFMHSSVVELREQVVAKRRSAGERRGRPRQGSESSIHALLRSSIARVSRLLHAIDACELSPRDLCHALRQAGSNFIAAGAGLLDQRQAAPVTLSNTPAIGDHALGSADDA